MVTDTPALELQAAPSASGAVIDGQALSVRVTLSNKGARATGPLRVELRLDGARVVAADELSTWFAVETEQNSPLLDDRVIATRASVGALGPGDSAVLDLTVPATSPLWGVSFVARLVEVAVADGQNWRAFDRTAVVWAPGDTTPPVAATTFVQPLTTPGEPAGLLSAETLAAVTAESGALTRTLAASAGRAVLLAIDPRVIASITALGDETPASALDFLDRLRSVPNESFLLPWADADPMASIAANGVTLPQPEGTGRLVTEAVGGDPVATPSPSNDSSEGPDDVEAVAATQSIADLLDLLPTIDAVIWPERSGFSADAVDAVTAEGTRVIVTPSSALESSAAVQRHGDTVLLRVDEALAEAAQAAASAASQQQFDRAIARVSALIAAAAAQNPGSPALITLDREAPRSNDRLLDTLAQTIALPWSTAATTSAAIARPASDAVVRDLALDEAREAAVTAALEAESADRQFADIALPPALITDVRRLELLGALSLGWGDSSVEALRGFVSESEALRASVQVVESSAILLLTDRATLPVTVQNDLDVAVRVFVRVDPDTAQLRVLDPAVEAVVEPQSQARALVPVESLTNGDVDITVTVRDAQGRVLSDPTRVSLSLQAGWETAGTIIVAAAVAVLFIVGIVRDLRKRRRRSADSAAQTDRPDVARKDPV